MVLSDFSYYNKILRCTDHTININKILYLLVFERHFGERSQFGFSSKDCNRINRYYRNHIIYICIHKIHVLKFIYYDRPKCA